MLSEFSTRNSSDLLLAFSRQSNLNIARLLCRVFIVSSSLYMLLRSAIQFKPLICCIIDIMFNYVYFQKVFTQCVHIEKNCKLALGQDESAIPICKSIYRNALSYKFYRKSYRKSCSIHILHLIPIAGLSCR